jgi:hypothetical protein
MVPRSSPLGIAAGIVRASRSDVIGNVCYSFVTGKWFDTLRTELHESLPPVSLDPYRAGASILSSFVQGCLLVPNLIKSNIRYAFVTEMA